MIFEQKAELEKLIIERNLLEQQKHDLITLINGLKRSDELIAKLVVIEDECESINNAIKTLISEMME